MGVGRKLATSAIERASTLGYREAMLDTLPWMTPAIAIYRSLGFEPIAPYWNNLVPGIIYLGKETAFERSSRADRFLAI
jgi:ribosomal protein S18 acetylase RimI-like enzyme